MRAIVLKSRTYTAAVSIIVNQLVLGIEVIGSICLDYEIGGLNFHALENAARLGAKVVWMPTFSAVNSINRMRALGLSLEGEGISILDRAGKLVPEMQKILELIKNYDMVLATGHISPQEIIILFEEAQKTGIRKFWVTHPTDKGFAEEILSIDELQQLARNRAFIELTLVGMLPNEFGHDPTQITQVIKSIGPQHCIISTDLGQPQNPLLVEGIRLFINMLLHHGLTQEEIELMAKVNPAKLLDLD